MEERRHADLPETSPTRKPKVKHAFFVKVIDWWVLGVAMLLPVRGTCSIKRKRYTSCFDEENKKAMTFV